MHSCSRFRLHEIWTLAQSTQNYHVGHIQEWWTEYRNFA